MMTIGLPTGCSKTESLAAWTRLHHASASVVLTPVKTFSVTIRVDDRWLQPALAIAARDAEEAGLIALAQTRLEAIRVNQPDVPLDVWKTKEAA